MEELNLLEDNKQFPAFKPLYFAVEEDKEMLKRFYDEITGLIIDTQKHVKNNFVALGWALYRLRESCLYPKFFNFNSLSNYWIGNTNCFYDVCYDYFHLRKSSVKAYIEVVEKFCVAGVLKPEYENYSYSALVEMCSLPPDCLPDIKPTMTVGEIRRYKQEHLTQSLCQPKKVDSSSQTSGCKSEPIVGKVENVSLPLVSDGFPSVSVREAISDNEEKAIDVKLLKTVFVQYVKDFMEEFSYELNLCGRKQAPKVFAGTLFNRLKGKGFFDELV